MKGKLVVRWISVIGGVVLIPFLVTTVLHPIWLLQVVFLSLMCLFLAGLAAFMAVKVKRPCQKTWVDWVALGTVVLTLWWLFWIPHLLLPFSLQVLCRILGISLSPVAAVALHRALPQRFCRLGALFPLAPIVLSFLLPLGPARWEIGPLSPYEVAFAGELLVVRAQQGTVLVYGYPEGTSVATAGFSPYQLTGYPSLALGDLGAAPYSLHREWALTAAALESESRLGIATILPSGAVDRRTYPLQTDSMLLAVAPGPEHNFLAIYRDRELNVWGQQVDTQGRPVGSPIRLPGRPQALAVSPDGTLLAYVEYDLRSVRVVDLGTGEDVLLDLSGEIAAAGGGESYLHSLALAPDGGELALGLSWKAGTDCPGLVWRVDLAGNVVAKLLPPTAEELAHEPFVSMLAYDDRGERLAAEVCCFPSRLSVIEVDSGAVRDLPLGAHGFSDLAFSPDGKYLVATAYDGIYLWRIGR